MTAVKANPAMTRGQKQEMMIEMNVQNYEKFDKEALVACSVCGRTFLPDRLKIH